MRYEGNIYRPPSEAYSLILQATIGCAHNGCTFCSMFKDKRFRARAEEEVMADIDEARRTYTKVRRVFLADGDALALSTERLARILRRLREAFPGCERIGIYGSPQDVLSKGAAALKELKGEGLGIIYIGGESGSDRVLAAVNKGADSGQIAESIIMIEEAGIPASATFISGLGGEGGWEGHALGTAGLISRSQPSYVGLLTLMVEPGAPIYGDIKAGRFRLLPPEGIIKETQLMLENIEVARPCVFRSNHASNYLSLKGTLPEDKGRMLEELKEAAEGHGHLKDEYLRML